MIISTDNNKALVRQFFAAIENHQLEEFDRIVAANYKDHLQGQSSGREALKKYFAGLHSAFENLKLPILTIVAEADLVAVYNSIQGIHRGDYGDYKAKGNAIDAKAFQLYRVENGLLAEHWEVPDFMTLFQQIRA